VPTRENLLRAMRWLVDGASAGDSLVFHFSGHGVQKLDMNDDEVDGYNEALCPMDFERSGKILDDEINATIVRPLGKGVKLHAIVDTCHSGTILDLPYLCRMSRYTIAIPCISTVEMLKTHAYQIINQKNDGHIACRSAFQELGTGSGRITPGLRACWRSAPTEAWPSPSAAAATTRSPPTPAYVCSSQPQNSSSLLCCRETAVSDETHQVQMKMMHARHHACCRDFLTSRLRSAP